MSTTPLFSHVLLPASNPQGKYVLSVVAKTRYRLNPDGKCVPEAEPVKLEPADKFFDNGDPLITACEVESDFIPWKPQTDIIVIGKACGPRGKEVIRMGLSVQVGSCRKDLVVTGDRQCQHKPLAGPVFSNPIPFTEMPLRYERAYGGMDILSFSEAPVGYPRNPLGRGFVVKKKKETLDGLALPNIEDPNFLLTPENLCVGEMKDWHRMPMPAGVGVFGKIWYPRCSFAGVMPADMPLYEQIHEMSAGLVPPDQVEKYKSLKMPMLDFKFFNGASPSLAVPYLKGNEKVRLEGMDAAGPIEFTLPGGAPVIRIDYGPGLQTPEVVLQTVVIRAVERTLDMVWRGACEYPGPTELEKLTKLDVVVEAA